VPSFARHITLPAGTSEVGESIREFGPCRAPAPPAFFVVVLALLSVVGCSTSRPAKVASSPPPPPELWKAYQTGRASWYGGRWHRRLTANGECYDQESMTAAHRSLPFNTRVRVTNLRSGECCVVRINNRGPYIRGRVIDLSRAAARRIGLLTAGVAPVKLEVPR
jgi:rare lipoprotein A